MKCLEGYIGAPGCGDSENVSGLSITNLPGVSLRMIDFIADDDQDNFAGVWADVEKRALKRFAVDIRAKFHQRYKLKSLRNQVVLPRTIDLSESLVPAAEYRGISIDITGQWGKPFGCSNLEQIYIQQVVFYATVSASIVLKVFNLDTGAEIYTKTVPMASVIVGWNNITIEQFIDAKRIFIAVDCTGFETKQLDISEICQAVKYTATGCNQDIFGARTNISASIISSDLTKGDNAFGVSVGWSTVCSYENIVCQNRALFAESLMYCLGVELMNERIFTDRLNEYTAFDRNKARELRQLFAAYYQGGTIDEMMVAGSLQQAVDGININTDDGCIECDAPLNAITGVRV